MSLDYDYWNSEYVDSHRRGISDIQWASMQPKGKPKYRIGDVIEFKVGGFGFIKEVSKQHNGWPASYSVNWVFGLPGHPRGVVAWHYEGDIKRRLFWRTLLRRI